MGSWWIIGALLFVFAIWLLSRAPSPPGAPTSPEERANLEQQLQLCLASRRKIDAIKLYRALHGVDLKTSKEAVESLLVGGSVR
jgi:ribosomal protein L7/L12